MKNLLEKFVKSSRNYRPYGLHMGIIEKSFNGGAGAIELFRFYFEKKTIVINSLFFTKSDERKLNEFCEENGMQNWRRKKVSLGYPSWYFHHLSING